MDVYHKVLVKLLEASGGKESALVDLKELVKKEGFLPSYPQIREHLSRESWITETNRGDSVKITHWGIKEAKNSAAGGESANVEFNRALAKAQSEAAELSSMLGALGSDPDIESVVRTEKKAADLAALIAGLKTML